MSRRALVLQLLTEAGPRGVTTAEFLEAGCGSRFGGRIFELRRDGHAIDARPIRTGSYRYTLRAPEPQLPPADLPAAEAALFEFPPPRPLNAALVDYEDTAA